MKLPFTTKIGSKIFAALAIVLLVVAALPVRPAYAATITSTAAGGLWDATTTWVGGVVPAAGDVVIIATTNTRDVILNITITQTAAGSVTVNNGAILNGTAGGGLVYTFGALTIASGGTVNMRRNFTVLGATDITGTINFASTSGTSRAITLTGPVTLNTGAVWTEPASGNGANNTYNFGNNFTNNATTFTAAGTGLHTFSGTGGTISGGTATSFDDISFTGSYTNSNVLNALTAMTVATGGALTNNGTITSPTITVTGTGTLTNNGAVTVSSSLAGTGGFTNISASSVLNIGGGSTITTLTATAAGNKVYYNSAADQTVHANAYSYLYLAGGGVKTINTGTSVTANLDINGPTASVASGFTMPATTLSFAGVNQATGTWGSTSSAATHQDNTHFSTLTTGMVNVSAAAPTVTTNAATLVSTTGATLNGTVNANNASTTVTFEYGLTAAYDSTVTAIQSPVTGTTNTAVSAAVPVLIPNTLYHFRVVGANVGGTVNGLDATFTTAATLAVTGPASVTYGTPDTITTVGGSGTGALSFATVASTGCTVNPATGVITVTDASGTCTVTATKAADATYVAQTSANFSVTLNKAAQATLTVTGPASVSFGTTDTITTSGGSGTGAMSYSEGTSTGCTVNPGTGVITVTNVSGTCVVNATKAADNNYLVTTSADFTVTLNKATPVITFDPAPTPTYLGGNFTVNATTTNTDSNALTYSYVSGPCAFVSGATFSSTGGGTCVVQADGAATTNFNAASQQQSVTIAPANQAILTVTGPASVTYGTTDTITTSGGSGTGALSYSEGASTGCTVNPGTGVITVTDASGTCVVTATKAADANYNSTTSAPFTVTLNKAAQATLTVTGPASVTYGTTDTITTSGGSGTGALSYSEGASTGCTVNPGTGVITVTDVSGTCVVTATKAADNNYLVTTSAPFTVTLNKGAQATLTVTGPASVTYGSTGTITTSGGSGTGAMSYSEGASTGCTVNPSTGVITVTNVLGTCTVTATKAGDTNYNSTTSAPFNVTLNPLAPTVTTQAVTGIGMISATGNGNITDLGAPNPTAHGVVWNTTGTPTTADSVSDLGAASATGAFVAPMTGLSMNTVYYVRAFATNTAGTVYGAEVSFQTTGIAPTLSPVHIQSNNANTSFAKVGDTITLSFTASASITTPTVTIVGKNATVAGGPVNWTTTYTVVAGDPNGLVAFNISNFSDLFGNAGSPVTSTTDGSSVTIMTSTPAVAGTTPTNNAILTAGPIQIIVEFNKDVLHDGSPNAADNVANYRLVEIGANYIFNTLSCAGGLVADDLNILINSVSYTNNGGTGPFRTTLNINGGVPLPAGTYRLFVCGTTSVRDAAGNILNDGLDSQINFTVQLAQPAVLPATGFAPDRVTGLPSQPAENAYASLGSLWLEIPTLGVKMSIVGVPQIKGNWDVSWLGSQAGWLQGSAFPTWVGNSVVTAHVTGANGKNGPFAGLKNLMYGDRVIVHMQGQQYIYEVRETRTLNAGNSGYVFQSLDKYSYLTLLTCKGYNPLTDKYTSRQVVRAVLISIQADK